MNALRATIVVVVAALVPCALQAATFSIRATDAAGEGLNDATPFAAVGGNTATTLGDARMNVLQEAARIWGTLLESNVPILVDAAFDPLTCTATSGTLGSAGPRSVYRNFGGGVSPDVYYVSALADALRGVNESSNPASADIVATFNSAVDNDATCLGGRGFYYGLDHNRGGKIDLLLVVLHEFGHGLGFTSGVDLATGKGFVGSDNVERFDSFTQLIFDEQFGSVWPALTDAQRLQSATHTGNLGWNGSSVNGQISRFTQGVSAGGRVRLYAPAILSNGSSVSHFDSAVTPSVLMEPNLPSTIVTSSTDITVCALRDIGWTVNLCPHFANNHPPNAVAQSVALAEDTSISIALNGVDVDNDPLTFAIATPPTHGTLSAISSTTPHTVVYTPNANVNGNDSFTFTVNDGAVTSAPAIIALAIAPVNDAPIAADSAIVTTAGQTAHIDLLGSDIDNDTLTYIIVSNPSHGTLIGAGASLTYQPNEGYAGADSFTFRVNDGAVNSAPATVTITVQSPPATANASSSSGGGGAMTSLWFALLLSFASLRLHLRKVYLPTPTAAG